MRDVSLPYLACTELVDRRLLSYIHAISLLWASRRVLYALSPLIQSSRSDVKLAECLDLEGSH